jgi:hypothetical protein
MTVIYRIKTSLLEFDTVGRLERAGDTPLLRLSCTTDQAFAIQNDVNQKRSVEILACVGDEVVMPGRTTKVKARPDGARVELACILG